MMLWDQEVIVTVSNVGRHDCFIQWGFWREGTWEYLDMVVFSGKNWTSLPLDTPVVWDPGCKDPTSWPQVGVLLEFSYDSGITWWYVQTSWGWVNCHEIGSWLTCKRIFRIGWRIVPINAWAKEWWADQDSSGQNIFYSHGWRKWERTSKLRMRVGKR